MNSLPMFSIAQSETDPTALHSLLDSYFQSFGGKACCYEDLRPYIEFEGEDLAQWNAVLEKQTATFVCRTDCLCVRDS